MSLVDGDELVDFGNGGTSEAFGDVVFEDSAASSSPTFVSDRLINHTLLVGILGSELGFVRHFERVLVQVTSCLIDLEDLARDP